MTEHRRNELRKLLSRSEDSAWITIIAGDLRVLLAAYDSLKEYMQEHLGEYPACTCDMCLRAKVALEK